MTTTFIQPDYTFGNSKDVQDQMIGVLSNLDQALQSLQPSPASNTVQFNDTIILSDGSTNTNTINNNSINIIDTTNNFTYYNNSSSISIADATNSINTDIDTSIGFVITDGGNNKSGFLSANQLALNDNITGEIATLQLTDLTISDNNGQVMVLNKNSLTLTNTVNVNTMSLGNSSFGFTDSSTTETLSLDRRELRFSIPGATPAFTITTYDRFEATDDNNKTSSLLGNILSFVDNNNGQVLNLNSNSLAFSDNTNVPLTIASNTDIAMTSMNTLLDSATSVNITGGDYLTINATNDSIGINANNDINLDSANLGRINLNAPNINSYGYALPICLNGFFDSVFSYTLGSQVFEDVLIANPLPIVSLPTDFFAFNPPSGYSSTRWQINFDMNIFGGSNLNDKGFAIYLLFNDSLGTVYTPFLYNSQTPFCRWANSAGYSGGAPPYMSVNWCDYVDFNEMIGTAESNINIQMWIAGDNPISGGFRMKLGFTRINRV